MDNTRAGVSNGEKDLCKSDDSLMKPSAAVATDRNIRRDAFWNENTLLRNITHWKRDRLAFVFCSS